MWVGIMTRCKHVRYVKHGHRYNVDTVIQRYWCKSCGYRFSFVHDLRCRDPKQIVQALKMYVVHGKTTRPIGKKIGVSHVTIARWVEKYT